MDYRHKYRFPFIGKIAKSAEPVNDNMNSAFHAPPLTVLSAFGDWSSDVCSSDLGDQGRKALKWLPAHFSFEKEVRLPVCECGYLYGTFCPHSPMWDEEHGFYIHSVCW